MNAVNEYEAVVDKIYGVYLDATTGFDKLSEWIITNQSESLNMLKKKAILN